MKYLPNPEWKKGCLEIAKTTKIWQRILKFSFFFRVYKSMKSFVWDRSAWGRQGYQKTTKIWWKLAQILISLWDLNYLVRIWMENVCYYVTVLQFTWSHLAHIYRVLTAVCSKGWHISKGLLNRHRALDSTYNNLTNYVIQGLR